MTERAVTNLGASVRQRLLNLARERGEPFNQLLQYYAIERFLARLAMTPRAQDLVVKGATLLRIWDAPLARPTRDVDFHTRLTRAPEAVDSLIHEVVAVEVDDGLAFEPEVTSKSIVVDGRYPGVRAVVRGELDGALFKLQIDVGVGDDAVPEPAWVDYPTLLDMKAPRVLAYAPETAIAEKFEAMVSLGTVNSRVKDFYDVWLLAGSLQFDGERLGAAIKATFAARGTALSDVPPVALSPSFAEQPETRERWTLFIAKPGVEAPTALTDVIEMLAAFLMPVAGALVAGRQFTSKWSEGGPWRAAVDEKT